MFAEAKPPIQLYSQVLDAPALSDFVFTKYNLWISKESPVCDQQSLGLLRSHFKASAVQPTLYPLQTLIDSQLQDLDVISSTHNNSQGWIVWTSLSTHQPPQFCPEYWAGATRDLTVSLAAATSGNLSMFPDAAIMVWTLSKRLYSLQGPSRSGLHSCKQRAATTTSLVTVSSRSLFLISGPGGSPPFWFFGWSGPPVLHP